MSPSPDEMAALAARAAALVPDGAAVGLGTGRAAAAFARALADRVRAGLAVRVVPTSREAADLAAQLGLPATSLDDVDALDLAADGADEVDPAGNLIKGYGGAMVREKVVAAVARRFVILVGPEKLVPILGTRGRLPVEVVPFAAAPVRRRLAALGYPADVRPSGGRAFVTDNGNAVLDLRVGPLADPAGLEAQLRALPGVVGTGLFLGMADAVLVSDGRALDFPRPRA